MTKLTGCTKWDVFLENRVLSSRIYSQELWIPFPSTHLYLWTPSWPGTFHTSAFTRVCEVVFRSHLVSRSLKLGVSWPYSRTISSDLKLSLSFSQNPQPHPSYWAVLRLQLIWNLLLPFSPLCLVLILSPSPPLYRTDFHASLYWCPWLCLSHGISAWLGHLLSKI